MCAIRPVVGVYLVFLCRMGPLFMIWGQGGRTTLPGLLFFNIIHHIIHLVRVPTPPATAPATAAAATAGTPASAASWITGLLKFRAVPFHMAY